MAKTFKLSDSVSMRLIQIFQEAMLFGWDGADLMRQVTLVEGDDGTLELDEAYVEQVKEMHEKMLAHAEELREMMTNEETSEMLDEGVAAGNKRGLN